MTDSVHDSNDQLARLTAAARTALDCWSGAFDEMTLVKYRENAVFRVRSSGGESFALRVHRPGYHSEAALLSELQWISALSAAGVDVPAIIPTQEGSLLAKVTIPSFAEPVQVDMLAWFEGQPIGSIDGRFACSPEDLDGLYHQIGQIAARLHEQAKNWQRPEGFARHAWDAQGLLGPNPFWGEFRELPLLSAHLPLIDRACQKAAQDLQRLGHSPQCYGLIHADLVPENVLCSGNRMMLIDFDDAGFGWHMFELATALFFHTDQPYYGAIREALFAGYASVRPLPEQHRQLLQLFLFLRSLTYLGWVQTRSETDTAKELAPFIVEKATLFARDYLRSWATVS